MLQNERSRDLYELIPGYPKALQAPIPAVNSVELEKRLGLKLNRFTRPIVSIALYCSGFKSFLKAIPKRLEKLQRRVNLRGPALFAPVVSATLALEDDPRINTMLDRAVTLLKAAHELCQAITSAKFPADYVNSKICEMGQYPNFFSTSIVFENNRPRIFKSTKQNQITVIVANRIYIVKIDDWESATILVQLKAGLNHILQQAKQDAQYDEYETPAIITATKDLLQYKAFKVIKKDQTNIASLDALRHSFLTLCLDIDEKPKNHSEALLKAHSSNFANRWNHSSLQIIVFENAKACTICHFSAYLDGNTMVRGIAELQNRASKIQIADFPNNVAVAQPRIIKLDWNIERSIIKNAKDCINSILDSQKSTYSINGVGSLFFNEYGCKAVPSFVIALQLAIKRLTGKIIPITQFITMSKYRCMDLTTAIVTTNEVENFVLYMDSEKVKKIEALVLLKNAIKSQTIKIKSARSSMPIDDLISYYIHSSNKIKKLYLILVFGLLFKILQKAGALESMRRNIVISHPAIYEKVPLIGRPGVKLPYVTYFGLHYQIFADSIKLTFMPGLKWTITNEQLFSELCKSLHDVESIITMDDNKQSVS